MKLPISGVRWRLAETTGKAALLRYRLPIDFRCRVPRYSTTSLLFLSGVLLWPLRLSIQHILTPFFIYCLLENGESLYNLFPHSFVCRSQNRVPCFTTPDSRHPRHPRILGFIYTPTHSIYTRPRIMARSTTSDTYKIDETRALAEL